MSELTHVASTTNLTLSCESTGAPPTNFTWLKNGMKLGFDKTTTEFTQALVDRNSSTYFTSLTTTAENLFELTGNYTCLIRNKVGHDSGNATIEGIYYVSLKSVNMRNF